MKQKGLRVIIAAILILCAGSWGLYAKNRKGDKFFKQGKVAESHGDWDAALSLYEQAVDTDPNDTSYVIAMRKARFEAGQKHVDAARKLRNDGKLPEALAEFQKALISDPSSAVAIQEIRRTQDMLSGSSSANPAERGLTPAERVRRQMQDRVDAMLSPPELKPMTQVIPTLKMNNQPPKVLFDTLGKLGGVNVVFDSQYNAPAKNFNVDLTNTNVEQAFDYLAVLTHTFWKPLTPNTIFVTEDNVTKRRDYEDEVVKVFYITNATSVQEFQEIATAIRTVAEIRRVFTYNAQKAMIVRGTVDQVALAEKLVHDLDKPKSEVVVDVMVMQANSERTRDLAATIATAGTAGLNMSAAFLPQTSSSSTSTTSTTGTTSGSSTTSGSVTLAQLAHLSINQWSTSLPGALLQAMLADSRTRVLNNPQLRASDGQKATLKIGSRIPYATGSFQPGVGTVGVSPLVSTQFNYADVGVNVDITPQVHSTDEVTLHIEVTVSSVQQYTNLGGIEQPIIGQNANTADIRLHEGEVNILGGLSQVSDVFSSNGIPGLVDIPVLGHFLFGNNHTDKVDQELLIALVPHIVRTPDYTAENLRGIYAGTDQVVKVNYAPRAPEQVGPVPNVPGPAGPAPGPVPPVPNVGGSSPSPAPANNANPVPPAPAPQTAPQAGPPAGPQAGPQARLTFNPAIFQVAPGTGMTVNVQVENATDLVSLSPLKIKFNPAQVRLNDITPGDLLSRDGVRVTSVKDIRNDTGEATITIARLPGSAGVSGSGTIAVLNFTAVAAGAVPVTVTEAGLRNSKAQPVNASMVELPVKVE